MIENVLSALLKGEREFSHPARFAIMVTVIRHGALTMSDLQKKLPLTFGNLERHVAKLKRAGFVESRKMLTWKGLRTVVEASRKGILATVDHANTLQALLDVPIEGPAEAHEAFLISKDGRLIAHEAVRESSIGDAQLVSATLVAIRDFIEKGWGGGEEMREIQFGTRRLLLGRGEEFTIAVVMGQGSAMMWKERLKSTVDYISEKYGEVIGDWDGTGELGAEVGPHLRRFIAMVDSSKTLSS